MTTETRKTQAACSVADCERPSHKESGGRRGFCQAHYVRWRTTGDPLSGIPVSPMTRPRDAIERFESVIDKTAPNGCWQWLRGGTGTNGGPYGSFVVDGVAWMAHRFAYTVFVGEIPEGETIDHLCRNTLCVNPAHLEAVSMRENILRGTGPTALNSTKTHCPKGHEYTPENTTNYRGSRYCKRCNLDRTWAARYPTCMCGHNERIHQDGGTGACEGFLTLFDGDPGPCYCHRFAAAGTVERIRGGR